MGHHFGRNFLVATAVFGSALLAGSRGASADPPPIRDGAEISLSAETTIEDFLKAVGPALGVRLAWDPSSKLIKDKRIVPGVLRAEPARMLTLVRNLLVPYDLVLVPMGSAEQRSYFVMDPKQQGAVLRLKPESIELTDESLARYEGEDGLYVTATIRVRALKNLRDARTALTKVSTQMLGNVTEVPDANAFVVTDFAPTAVALYRLIRQLDVAPAEPASPNRLVTLRHARAEAVGRLLHAHFAPPTPTPAMPQQGQPAAAASAGPRISPDARTNQLLVGGSPAEIQAVLKLIEGLDIPVEAPAPASAGAPQAPTAHVLTLRNAKALELARVLQNVVQSSTVWMAPDGLRPSFVADPASNLLVVAAHEKSMPAIRALVELLDVPVAAPKEPPPAPPLASTRRISEKTISIRVQERPLSEVLLSLPSLLGAPVVANLPMRTLEQRITLDMKETQAGTALDLILKSYGLTWSQGPDGVVRVREAPKAEGPK